MQKVAIGRPIQVNDINTNTLEGRLLMSALARLTVKVDTDKTPDQCLQQLLDSAQIMFKDSKPINITENAVTQLCESLIDDTEYFQSWMDNISMAFQDEFNRNLPNPKLSLNIRGIANKAAHNFLDMLINRELKKYPKKTLIKHKNGDFEELVDGISLNRERQERNFCSAIKYENMCSSENPKQPLTSL